MSTISASTTSTTAYKVTADTTGTLVLQTGSSPTTAVTIDSSQNVGIGAVPTGFPSGGTLTLPADKAITSAGNGLTLGNNWYYNSGDKFAGTGYATQYYQYSGTHRWSVSSASGSAGGAVTFNEAMRIDSSGNVGIGTSSPTQPLTVGNTSTIRGQVYVQSPAGSSPTMTLDYTAQSGGHKYILYSGGSASGNFDIYDATAAAYRATIDSSGNLLVGTTSNSTGYRLVLSSATSFGIYSNSWHHFCSSTNEFNFTAGFTTTTDVYFNYRSGSANSGANAYITQYRFWNGNAGSGVYVGITAGAYTNGSDYRLKSNIELLANGSLDKILSLTPRTFIFRGEDKTTIGFVAHEVQEFIPEAVSGVKDGVDADGDPEYQGIDYAQITTSLVKAIQELKAELDAAKADIATLKGAA